MSEEEYFRKNYPDSCYGDKPLSPHWDFFQSGVEFGERQSEKKIEELEEQIGNAKGVLTRLLNTVVHTDNMEEAMMWLTLKKDAEFILKELT